VWVAIAIHSDPEKHQQSKQGTSRSLFAAVSSADDAWIDSENGSTAVSTHRKTGKDKAAALMQLLPSGLRTESTWCN